MKNSPTFSAKKCIVWLGACVSVVLVAMCMINCAVLHSSQKYIISENDCPNAGFDCILVLGARVYDDAGSLSPVLQDRMDCALRLLDKGVSEKMLLSGDHGTKEYDEVNSMLCYAVNRGVDKEVLFQDHAGFSTYESMVRAKEVFDCKKILIVTQASHVNRAVYIARTLGMEAYGVASDARPYASAAFQAVREFFARNKDFFSCLLQVEPTYGGEMIPISGSASPSHDKV